MRLWPAVAGAALLVLGAEASVRDTPARTPRVQEEDPAVRLAQARDGVARAEARSGPSSPETARALAGQAFLLWTLEQYEAGLPIAERALAIRLAAPRETAELAGSLYQVADFRRATGDLAGALDRYRGAIAVWTRLFGPDHDENGSAWHYIGILHGIAGDPEGARKALERALAIRTRALGPDDVLVATTLHALAGLARRTGDGAAETLFARAQGIWERALGPRDPMVARGLLARAGLRLASGDVAGARPLLERALSIRLEAFGPRHHLVARARMVRAELMAREGDFAAAADESEAALEVLRATLGPAHPEVAAALADRARLLWSAGRRSEALVSALAAERMARGQFLRSARDLDASLALRYAAARTSGLDVLLTAVAEGASGAGTDAADAPFDPAAAAREAVDALFRSRGMVLDGPPGPGAPPDDPGLEEVRRAMLEGSALVAYARYDRIGGVAESPLPSYVAIVLRSGRAAIAIIPLGAAALVDAAVSAWRAEITRDPAGRMDGDPEREARARGEAVRRAIWDPLEGAIGGARQVFVVPDGDVGLVPFAALPSGGGRFLAESGPLFHSLSTERDLVTKPRSAPPGRGLLAIGGPDFDAPARSPAVGGPGARPLCPEFGALAFEPLPGAAGEAREVAALAAAPGEAVVLGGAAATAREFVSHAAGRRIVHLATHAYVLPQRCGQADAVEDASDPAPILAERVLMRSGLAFAGANLHGGAAADGDGILTAEEIAALDLSGVEWVVLSACDTGLGEVHAGEGVVGLRHAFERAGAATVIMSLWGADDAAARAFMRALYAARGAGASTPEAMRSAALDLLESQRARGRTTHPYYWGGFVAAGDWR